MLREREYGTYVDRDFDRRECVVLEVNGNLTLIECTETGELDWLAPHEVEREN